MKNRKNIICWFMLLCGMLLSASCNDFLNIVPKGQKIPTTLADYEALLRYEYNIARTPVMNALYLLNDRQVNKSELNSATLTRANYLWDESADRIELNNSSEDTYYCLYGAISTCNLLLENVPSATECTEAQRTEVMAYARVIRALCYFNLVNFYADTYEAATAASKLAVPWITSANINAPSRQVTVEELYGYMLEDIRTALDNGLPEESMTVLHPNRAAAHALLARIYLQMGNYEDALHYAEEALKYKDELFDWVAYYEQHKAQLELPGDYTEMATPMDHNYVENYYFRHGENNGNQVQSESKLPVERGARFETGIEPYQVVGVVREVAVHFEYPVVAPLRSPAKPGDVGCAQSELAAAFEQMHTPGILLPTGSYQLGRAVGRVIVDHEKIELRIERHYLVDHAHDVLAFVVCRYYDESFHLCIILSNLLPRNI